MYVVEKATASWSPPSEDGVSVLLHGEKRTAPCRRLLRHGWMMADNPVGLFRGSFTYMRLTANLLVAPPTSANIYLVARHSRTPRQPTSSSSGRL
jgi:hypothetical protein